MYFGLYFEFIQRNLEMRRKLLGIVKKYLGSVFGRGFKNDADGKTSLPRYNHCTATSPLRCGRKKGELPVMVSQ